jgi:hypothetical protein
MEHHVIAMTVIATTVTASVTRSGGFQITPSASAKRKLTLLPIAYRE